MLRETQKDEDFANFFAVNGALSEYSETKEAITDAIKPVKKKIYRSMEKLLKECYFVGSLKYGNNFIA